MLHQCLFVIHALILILPVLLQEFEPLPAKSVQSALIYYLWHLDIRYQNFLSIFHLLQTVCSPLFLEQILFDYWNVGFFLQKIFPVRQYYCFSHQPSLLYFLLSHYLLLRYFHCYHLHYNAPCRSLSALLSLFL